MKRYWVIAPYDSTQKELFDKAWQYDIDHGTIAIGWNEIADASKLNRSELESKVKELYPNTTRQNVITRDTNALWSFHHEIQIDDIIIARCGTKKIVSIGTVTGNPYYDKQAGIERIADKSKNYYPNFIPVKWDLNEIEFDKIVFSFYTLYEIFSERFQEIVEDSENNGVENEQIQEFVLEKYLEDFIVANFNKIFSGKLELYKDPEDNIGQQYPAFTDDGDQIGRIDILARDKISNDYIVIELKKGRESDQVVGQILRYMGWVEQNLCNYGENVRGLIICKEVEPKLIYALKMVSNIVDVKRYKVDFELVNK
jgi:predicted Mrr-cat superfamily restriction endonuclease